MIDDVNYKCKISHQLEQQLVKTTSLDDLERDSLPQLDYSALGRSPIEQHSISSLPPPPTVPAIQIPAYNALGVPLRHHHASPANAYGNLPQSAPLPPDRGGIEYPSQLVHGFSRHSSTNSIGASTPRTPYTAYNNPPPSYTPNNMQQMNYSRMMPSTKKTNSMYSMSDISSNLSSLSVDNIMFPTGHSLSLSNVPTPLAKDSLRGTSVYAMRDGFGGLINPSQLSSNSVNALGFGFTPSLNSSLNPSSVLNESLFLDSDEKTVRY